ncbi:MAG: pseudouridine synthase, partial [Acidimicrobiia bacterium]
MSERRSWVVPRELAGERLDRTLSVLSGRSRSGVRALIEAGEVTVEGRVAKGSMRLVAGSVIMAPPSPSETPPRPADVPFALSYEDGDMLVVDKPPGVVVHPGAGHTEDTLLNGLIAGHPELIALGEEHRFGIVHRLDRETSGLLVVARTKAAHATLQNAMRSREIERI